MAPEMSTPEPIAIIGMSCRFPGGASEPSRLWDTLSQGRSAWSEVPEDRFNMKAFYQRGDPHASTTNTAGGHFLDEDLSKFDSNFFGVKPLEARAWDPQQRLTLELAYEAFENAGLTIPQLWGSNTGVYVGQWSSDYSEVLARDPEYQELYHTLGAGPAITSNRVSFFFNLRGPSFTVDTGCSSSLVALHNAVQSLRNGESTMSLVGGVNVLLDPQRFTYQSKLKMFSPDGRSFSFDHRANGYGRGEGCGCVVLKPLSLAVKDGDRIRAVIRNSALNQDGRTPQGISVPSMDAQEELIRRAYAEVGLVPTETDYVEAHGTGTAVGDPIEAQAIAAVLAQTRKPGQEPLSLASVKGNIGHTESAAGIAGLIKSVLMLENQAIPPQVNYEKPNPKIPLDKWNLQIPTRFEDKPLRRISVNSFGYGGTNAHVIVDRVGEHNHSNGTNGTNGAHHHNGTNGSNGTHGTNGTSGFHDTESISDIASDRPRVFVVSGAEEQSCHQNAERLAQYLTKLPASLLEDSDEFLDKLAVSVNKRTVHDYSASVIAYDGEDLLAQLDVLQQTPVAIRAPVKSGARVGYVFGGQGAQYYNMGREMIKSWTPFRQSLDRANAHLKTMGCQWDLLTELGHEKAQDSHVDEPEYGQTLSTAVQLALVDTLIAVKMRPTSVVGHSSGEIAAAYAAGALSFEDALTVAYHRGRLTSQLIRTGISGGMLAVGSSPDTIQDYIEQVKATTKANVKIACYNSPTSVTLSGDSEAINAIAELLQDDDVFNRKLKTQGAAYHSQMMQAMEEEYRSAIAHIQPRPVDTSVTMMSSLLGKKLPAGFLLDGEYWARNLVSPVLFAGALRGIMVGDEHDGSSQHSPQVDLLLEIGPHATMQGAVKETLKGLGSSVRIQYLSCLKRKASAAENMLRTLADLFALGASVDLHYANIGFRTSLPSILNDLPPYAFNHDQRLWHDGRISHEFTHRQFLPHELLGNLSADVNHTEPRWRRFLRLKELPWLQHHVVQGQVIFPAAGYLAMSMEAMRRFTAFEAENQSKATVGYSFRNTSFSKALVLREDDADTEICLSLRPEARSARNSWQDWKEFRVFSISPGKGWSEHCRGRIRAVVDEGILADALKDTTGVKDRIAASVPHHITPNRLYATARQVGMEWYAPFDNVVTLQARTDLSVATNRMPTLLSSAHPFGPSTYVVHPGMLDSTLFHGLVASVLVEQEVKAPVVPTFLEQFTVSTAIQVPEGAELRTFSISREEGSCWSAQIELNGESVMSFHGLRTAQLPSDVITTRPHQLAHSPEWVSHYPSMTREQIIDNCINSVPAGSARQRNIVLYADVRAHVERALSQIQPDQVASGHQQPWYNWMKSFLATEPESGETVSEAREATKSEKFVGFDAVKIIGENLEQLLTGEVNSLSLLSTDDMLGRLYSEERNQRCYTQISAYCKAVGLYNPALKMLEVGGGTASATLPLLQALSHQSHPLVSQYDFTDLSTAFFAAARERLGQYGQNVNYEAFDLAQNPETQGFEPGSYDIIVACNVVHATPSIASSLEHIRQLLRPGGTLVLMEITNGDPFYQLIFGSLSGWWSGVDEGRESTAILSEDEWKQVLAEQSYQSDPIMVGDYATSEGGTISVIFAKTPVESQRDHLSETSLHFVNSLFADSSTGYLDNVAEHLEQRPELGLRQITTGNFEAMQDIDKTVVVIDPETIEALAGRMDASLWGKFQKCALSCKGLLLVSRGATGSSVVPEGALAVGFARSMRLEQHGIRYITLDLDPNINHDANELSRVLAQLLTSETFDFDRTISDADYEFAERKGQLHVNRLFPNVKLEESVAHSTGRSKPEQTEFLNTSRPLKVELGVDGLLETFRWVDDHQHARSLAPDEVRIECRAASINFRDVLIATGGLGGAGTMMNDCAGTVVEVGSNMTSRYSVGDRVCSYYAQSYNNYPIVDGQHCAKIPDNVSFALGASLPIVWATTYHSLVNVAKLKAGESILVHAAAGAVGQAAVILAQHLGAVVYATCGSQEKRERLESMGVHPDHIFTSRSPAFGPALRAATKNKGVNVILNSLAGELFRESLECLTSFGRFIEIGKKDFLDDALMPTKFLLQNITFACVDLVQMINEDKPLVHRLLNDVVELVASGQLKDEVNLQLYKLGEIESAFRLISAGKHMGKVILTVDQGETVLALPATPNIPKLLPDATYLLVGGFGGLGVRLIRWLASRGAKTIVTMSRSGAKSPAAKTCIEEMHSIGVKIIAKSCDISSKEALEAVVKELQDVDGLSPVRGVINAAMALEDAMFDQMTHQQWVSSLAPKVAGTRNLDEVLPNDMDFFVVLSSIAGIIGHQAQANYAAACTFQDAFMHYRRSQGRASFAIDVGVVSDAGFVSEAPAVFSNMKRQGFSFISVAELLATLDYALSNNGPDCQASIGVMAEASPNNAEWLEQRRISHLVKDSANGTAALGDGSGSDADHIGHIRSAKTAEEALEAVGQAVLAELSKLTVTPVDRILPHRTLDSYGVDSLVAVELRNWVVAIVAADLSLLLIRESRSIEELIHLVAGKSRLVPAKLQEAVSKLS
ncbi:Highly reducing polyketide synthase 40 [Fusarium poae]|uniref:Highly reducing polyketide synthase 40 n=1 Tax=Fusarium poae TaxID=36050 RepID=UPI001CE942A5|nr:Highly reducing polyketide synthase 40 [Fusarium poae]KAG8676086.1 Highly reducing polyketide synthase 40 [Fusarium poae]